MPLIIFDLDGTVLDTVDDLTNAANSGVMSLGFPKRSREEVMSFVGNGVAKLMERALPKGQATEENVKKSLEQFNIFYSEHFADSTRPYDGMLQMLEELKARGSKLAVFSNKPDRFSKELIGKFYPGIFDVVLGSRDGVPRKPDPTAELEIMHMLGAHPDEVLHIGDSDTDLAAAKNAGVGFVGVSWGYRSEESLKAAGAEKVAGSVDELKGFILEFLGGAG